MTSAIPVQKHPFGICTLPPQVLVGRFLALFDELAEQNSWKVNAKQNWKISKIAYHLCDSHTNQVFLTKLW